MDSKVVKCTSGYVFSVGGTTIENPQSEHV